MLLEGSGTVWTCHLGEGPGLGSWSLSPCFGRGSKGPRDALKPLDGPGLVPRILLLTAASQLLKVRGTNQNLGLA